MIDFFIKVKQQEKQNLPFVIYSKPNKNILEGYFQKDDHLYFAENFNESGFIFAPFDGNQTVLIPKNKSHKWKAILNPADEISYTETIDNKIDLKEKEHFKALVQKGIHAISIGDFSKVVVSRQEMTDLKNIEITSIFEKLVFTYPTAFTYCWFHPKIGLWMGATPEPLLKARNKKFLTTALAGTQVYKKTKAATWENKEIEEQRFVTSYIVDNLKAIASEVTISSPYTVKAGNLLHIKTDIEGELNKNSTLKEIVEALHPTPAVCGLPEMIAKKFIIENENYDRTYYSGFLGELNKKSRNKKKLKSNLYVNLRCMQIKEKKAIIYMGCGITKDSNPEKEWEESVNKSMTMKKIL